MRPISNETVFLLGAGFSKSLDNSMPLVNEIPELLNFEPGSKADGLRDSTFRNDFEAWFSSLYAKCPWLSDEEAKQSDNAFKEVLQAIQFGFFDPEQRAIHSLLHLAQDNDQSEWSFRLLRMWREISGTPKDLRKIP